MFHGFACLTGQTNFATRRNLMKKTLLATLLLGLATAPAMANLQLAQKYNCTTCHAVDKKLVGPAY